MLRPQPDEPGKGQLIRAAFIGLALAVPNIMWLVRTELVRGVYPTWLTLFPTHVLSISRRAAWSVRSGKFLDPTGGAAQ